MDTNVETNQEVSKRRVAICQTCSEAVKKNTIATAVILTHALQESDQIISYAHAFEKLDSKGEKAKCYINEHSQQDNKPVSMEYRKNKRATFAGETLFSYFEKNAGNPLVENEKIFLQSAGYDLWQGFYFAIPFEDGVLGPGLVFIFARNEGEKSKLEKGLKLIAKKMVPFSLSNL